MPGTAPIPDTAKNTPDLFESENAALRKARTTYLAPEASVQDYRQSLGELIGQFERMMRQTRRLIGHSDRAEREMHALNVQLQTLAQQFEYRATHDALTGVYNRSAVIEMTNKALAEDSAVMIVLDIDHFKHINDEFGHPAGDSVIQGIIGCLNREIGEAGFLGRVGGEEFTVLLPRCQIDDAVQLAETIRAAVAGHIFGEPINRSVTASFGLSANPRGTSFDMAYSVADTALYAAKRAGRNRVEVIHPGQTTLVD